VPRERRAAGARVADDLTRDMARPRVHLVGSLGGHLDLLRSIAAALPDVDRVWVTPDGPSARDLSERGERVRTLPPLDRDHVALANPRESLRLALEERPRLVLTSGPGFAVPFCAAARARGARILFVETMARVRSPSVGGRVLSALAERTFVQWPEMARVYRGALVCRPALLEQARGARPPAGAGTFVAVGSHEAEFHRCLALVDAAASEGILPGPVSAQVGHTRRVPPSFHADAWLDPDGMRAAVRDADVVVCHAGAGIVSAALRAGRRPIVVPRLGTQGEHVDDHQLELAAKLAQLGLVVRAEGPPTHHDVAAARRPLPRTVPGDAAPPLADAVRSALLAPEQKHSSTRPRRTRATRAAVARARA
jgi:UDP-N-acetylglucosamine--N-acetylmuramyl-(pentapeptide) pyrophosphoryl-undecaprenol N-acetylglucosamine transferase